MGRIVLGIAVIAAVGYVLVAACLYFFQEKFVYRPSARIEVTPASVGMYYEEVALVASDGVRLSGWYLPLADARGTVLFCHGNAGNISHLLGVAEDAHRLGLGILLFDYRGYGQSEGTPSEEGTHRDAEAAWNYLVQEAGLAPDQIAIIGRSLGGPIAARLARDKKPGRPVLGGDLYFHTRAGSRTVSDLSGWLARPLSVSHAGVPKAGTMPGASEPQPRRHVYCI